jgi:hypothetical protein
MVASFPVIVTMTLTNGHANSPPANNKNVTLKSKFFNLKKEHEMQEQISFESPASAVCRRQV